MGKRSVPWENAKIRIQALTPILAQYGGSMKTTVQKMISAFFFTIFSILIVTSFRADADQTSTVDDFVQNSPTAAKQDTQALSVTDNKYLIEKSTYHRFFTRAKDNLNLFGQQLTFVFSNYSQAPSEIVNRSFRDNRL